MTMPTLITRWNIISPATPAQRKGAGAIAGDVGAAQQTADEQEVQRQDDENADEPELLGKQRHDEVVLLFWQEVQLALRAGEQPFARESPGANRDLALDQLVAGCQRILPPGCRKLVSRSRWYGRSVMYHSGATATLPPPSHPMVPSFSPAAQAMTARIGRNVAAVPMSGCIAINTTGIATSTPGMSMPRKPKGRGSRSENSLASARITAILASSEGCRPIPATRIQERAPWMRGPNSRRPTSSTTPGSPR